MNGDLPNATKQIGWIKIAFLYACHFLKKNLSFEEAIRAALLLDGDTDTNAAIVGGLIGAARGIKSIPIEWVDSVLHSNNKRPEFLRT